MRTGSDVAYLDASALHKLVVTEPETGALERSERGLGEPRAVSRSSSLFEACCEPDVRRLLRGVTLIVDTNRVLAGAAQLEPHALRALDAIHVASALRLGSALAAFVSYDRRQLEAARALGLPVASPR